MENQEYIGSGWDVGFTGNDIWHILRRKETSVAMHKQLEDYIKENLEGETRKTALDFVEYLNVKRLTFYKDTCDYWKDKIYYWVKYEEQCVCFIAIANPDEPENLWTVWSDDSKVYEDESVSDEIKDIGWKYVDYCGSCGACGGGTYKKIFGKKFERVCGCTFRIDNAVQEELPFLKTMIDLRISKLLKNDVISHYDLLIDENNDPVHDPKPLQDYMNKWDGPEFIEQMQLDDSKSVLEIGVGTGRLAVRVAPLCGEFYGLDISSKTIERAKENLIGFTNVKLVCADFLSYEFERSFDVVYSSLTFMHIEDKQKAVSKIAGLLNDTGRFVLSIDKNPSEFIDIDTRRIRIYPDTSEGIAECIRNAGLTIINQYDTEFATIFVTQKDK